MLLRETGPTTVGCGAACCYRVRPRCLSTRALVRPAELWLCQVYVVRCVVLLSSAQWLSQPF